MRFRPHVILMHFRSFHRCPQRLLNASDPLVDEAFVDAGGDVRC